MTVPKTEVTGTFTIPENLTWSNDSTSGDAGTMVAVEDAGTDWRYFIVFRPNRARPRYDDALTGDVSGATFDVTDGVVGPTDVFEDHYTDQDTYLTALSTFAGTLRSRINPVPGGGTIVGLHYHEDQLYAIRDVTQITVPLGSETTLVPGMFVFNDADEMGEVLAVDAATRTANIAAVYASGFTLAANDAIHIALSLRFSAGTGAFAENDAVLGATSTWAGTVGVAQRRDGSWDSGNALGTVALKGTDAAITTGETFDNTTDGISSFVADAIIFAHSLSALTVESVGTQSDLSTLWRSTDDGWETADSGRTIAFDTGTNEPLSGTPVASSITRQASFTQQLTDSPLDQPWTTPFSNIEGAADASIIYANVFVDGFGTIHETDVMGVSDYNVGLLAGDTVTGIEIKMTSRNGTASSLCSFSAALVGAGVWKSVECVQGAALVETTAGGASDTWGATLTPDSVNASSFGFRFKARGGSYATSSPTVDSVEMVVHYESTPGGAGYLYDATLSQDIGEVTMSAAITQSGAWVDNDATGYLRLTDWTLVEVPNGTEIWTAPGGSLGGGILIGKTTGNVVPPALPGSALLDAERSKYQMISYNFFASEELNAIYGCSGAGQAFWYDGATLEFISTGVATEDDKPRHLAEHQQRLCLGYKWGEVYVSDANGPTTFSGQHFAASYGFGDKITGLMAASGDALAVFTESATHVLVGNNGGDTAVRQDVVNEDVGAIEYTVQSMGTRPIFTSFRGIETLETMDQYSNFFTAPLTYDVSPWLLDRLQVAAGAVASDEAVVNSVVIRNKNQYRLFFADGWVLTLTYVGKEKDPQNTTQQYWFNSNRSEYARCYATAQGVTTDGRDRAFFSVEPRPASPVHPVIDTPEIQYAFELDQGFSFDGGVIDSAFLLTHYFDSDQQGGPNVAQTKGFDCIQLHGYAVGHADLHLSRALNNEELDDPAMGYEPAPLGSLAEPATRKMASKHTQGRLNARGFAVSVHVSHSSAVEFPHTVQMITFTDDTQLRINR